MDNLSLNDLAPVLREKVCQMTKISCNGTVHDRLLQILTGALAFIDAADHKKMFRDLVRLIYFCICL